MNFIKETLAPNSLEVLFLQDGWGTTVSIKTIFTNAIRRHRASLKKLLIDSDDDSMGDFPDPNAPRWHDWRLNRIIVDYITSGKMVNLRELAVNLDYADWHLFLQRLPKVSTLRSLYIPHIAGHPQANIDPHELALQIVDIVTLRPEIQLCYMGIGTKCFEILENKAEDSHGFGTHVTSTNGPTGYLSVHNDFDEDQDDDDDDLDADDEAEDVEDEDDNDTVSTAAPSDDEYGNSDDDEWQNYDSKKTPKLRLQEILFYDKVSIFKARYGKL